MKRFAQWFAKLNKFNKGLAIFLAGAVIFTAVPAFAQIGRPTTPSPTITSQPKTSIQTVTPKIETKIETTTESVPFTSTTIDDATLLQGTTQTRTVGANGLTTHYFEVTYTDGNITSKKEVKSETTTAAINEVIAKGTKVLEPVCTDGSYTNSAGNKVCSPSSDPKGATAKCRDGSYSYSQSRSGTCSHHDGVAVWL